MTTECAKWIVAGNYNGDFHWNGSKFSVSGFLGLNILTSSCVYFAVGNLCSIIYFYNSELDLLGYHFHLGDHCSHPWSCGCAAVPGLGCMVLVQGLSVTRATKMFCLLTLVYRGQPLLNLPTGVVTMYFHDFFPTFPNPFCATIIDYARFAHLFIEQIFFLIFLENWKTKPKHQAYCLVNVCLLLPRW